MKGNKVTGKFYPLEIDYGQDEDAAGKLVSSTAGSTSKLPQEIQQLVRMLFDVESMKKAMLEFEVRKVELMVFQVKTCLFLVHIYLILLHSQNTTVSTIP